MKSTVKRILAGVAAVLVAGLVGTWVLLESSLPRRDGELALTGLAAPVEIELDALAIPRVRGDSLTDVFEAQGFMHGQERFFQMDLIRRSVAGELSALFGPRALPVDRARRPFEYRRRAREWAARLPAQHRQWLAAYTRGVNAGLADLGSRPPEYWLFGQAPAPWQIEDSLLAVYAIYTMLSNNEFYERAQAVMAETLSDDVYRLLTPSSTRHDRPLLAAAGDPTGGYRPLPIPDASVLDLHDVEDGHAPASIVDPPLMGQAASNQWAAAAERGKDGHALVANDPHLGFQMPNLFYRAELYWQGHSARGMSVPGLPGILIGANESVAWSATVSYADQADWIVIETDPLDPTRYRTPDGFEPFVTRTETIEAGDMAEPVEFRLTRWGPVVATDGLGRPLALKATWLEPDGANLDLLGLAGAQSIESAAAVIRRWSGPGISWSLAGSDGRVAWAMNGPVPDRVGFDGSRPESWADGTRRWNGYRDLPWAPPGTREFVFNANNRAVPIEQANLLSRMWMRSHRAERIEEMLEESDTFDELDFFRMQLDTQASAYEPIRELVLAIVPERDADPRLARARLHVAEWNGRADSSEPGFVILQVYFRALLERVLAPLLVPAFERDPDFVYRWPLAEEALLRIIEEEPGNLLVAGYPDWPAFLRTVLRETLERADAELPAGLDTRWGVVNRLDVAHPLAGLPLVGRLLALPGVEQPGSAVSIRVATPSRGAVFRMVVAPADPAGGILQMLGGQSGHFLSENFTDQHAAWANGAPTPFLAGETQSRIRLVPAR